MILIKRLYNIRIANLFSLDFVYLNNKNVRNKIRSVFFNLAFVLNNL